MKKYCIILIALWAALTAFAWFSPVKQTSDSERRPLAQMPPVTAENVLSGNFMEDFEDYSLDQFPLRENFRWIKSLFHYFCLGQKDNNGIYIADGYAAKQEYPLDKASLAHALERFNYLHEKYLTDFNVYMAIVPDKGYYLAQPSGHLAMDYAALFAETAEAMPWATHIDLTDTLTVEDYYRTDTHWRQEKLLPAAEKLAQALGVTAPKAEDYTWGLLNRPFYGVYYGQAALPMEPEEMFTMESDLLSQCTVYDHETGKTSGIYDWEKAASSRDQYDVYLSGAKSLLTIENPNASTDKELMVFRDSFGSSMIPLLVQDYAKVTLIDIRYIRSDLLDKFVDFNGQDVLMLYSTLVLNQSATIQ